MPAHIIMGPPCAGKTTYARTHAGTLPIIDLDDIEEQLGGTRYARTSPVRGRAIALRRQLIEQILRSGGEAFIIDTNPKPERIGHYRSHSADLILIDPGIDICLERAKNRPPHTPHEIRKWYSNPPNLAPGRSIHLEVSDGW